MMITVRLGHTARRAALSRTGQDPGEKIAIDFSQAPEAARAALARYYDAERREVSAIDAEDISIEALSAALIARAQAEDAERAQLEAAAREHAHQAMAMPIEAWIDDFGARMPVPPGFYCSHYPAYQAALRSVPGYLDRLAAAKQLFLDRQAAARAQAEAERRAKEQAEAAKEAAKQAYLDRWVREHGDELLRAQHADGLLCRRELLQRVAAWALAGLPEEHKIALCEDRDCQCGLTDVGCLPTSVYPAWRDLRALLPEGTTWQFERARDCQQDQDSYTALLQVPVGPFIFSRRVRLG